MTLELGIDSWHGHDAKNRNIRKGGLTQASVSKTVAVAARRRRKNAASSFKTVSECYRYDDVVDARSAALIQGEHREELSR